MWFSGNINIHKHNDNEAMKHVIINLGELLFADLTKSYKQINRQKVV